MSWWKKIRSVISGGQTQAGYWCEACRRQVPNPTTKAPPPGIEFPFYIRDSAGIQERTISEACDDCWQRHRQIAPEGEAQYRRNHPVEAVCAALRHPDLSVQENASRILSRLRDPRSVGPLIKAIQKKCAMSMWSGHISPTT
ncbi:HEAT repeat domain-containing protein [Streptomyces sp. TRM70350]|uniref:HEAT repeat domain-containing protein n=1 Tax=Streptomyces sp. TRM70350 TaxID=2856165 RepID=UPI001C44F6C3|nr:HEAT repeat domain-containing protein [Streptomyces sp. TRM70350]MBV7698612.1 HEAT repeat domain-containing protein [Streptomyces sp. TRM70350]